MAFAYKDRVKETTTTTGTGTITLAGAATGFRRFQDAFATSDTMYYVIDGGSGEWEVGLGTLSTTTTLARTTILASSNAGSAVNFSAGTKNVWCDVPAASLIASGTTLSATGALTALSIAEAVGTSAITVTGATQTTSKPVLDLSQTWNNVATTFTGLKFNVTDTNSASGSLLMDLQVGGTSLLRMGKSGFLQFTNLVGGFNGFRFQQAGVDRATVAQNVTGDVIISMFNSGGTYLYDAFKALNSDGSIVVQQGIIGFSTGGSSVDLYLRRDAANTLAQRNGTSAQTFNVYSSYTDASNYSRLAITGNSITSQIAGTGSYTVTASAPVLDLAQSWNNAGVTFTGIKFNVPSDTSASGSLLMDLQVGGVSKSSIRKSGDVAGAAFYAGTFSSAQNYFGTTTVILGSTSTLTWANSTATAGSQDVFLARDAANTLALRNSTNAQTFNWYFSYTDASNYARGALKTASGVVEVAAESAGTGAANIDLKLTTKGTGVVQYGTHSAIAAETVTGYITIKDAGGTTRKIAVVS